tara:strand:- start:2292 stop:3083 length:792 start_codon:yes stop_codon:yes gene_type:complete
MIDTLISFDIVRAYEYVLVENEVVKMIKKGFDKVTTEVNPNNFRETFILQNGKEPKIRYQMQSQVRMTPLNSNLVYINFPISFFIDEVRSTPYGHMNYKILKQFCEELDIDNLTASELYDKKVQYDKKYPELVRDLYPKDYQWKDDNMYDNIAWSDQFYPEQYWSFMKYGQMGAPLIDRPFDLFQGSAHSLLAAHLAKKKFMSLFIQIPKGEDSWCMTMPANIFKSDFTYKFFIDLDNKELWGKKCLIKDKENKDLSTYTKLL